MDGRMEGRREKEGRKVGTCVMNLHSLEEILCEPQYIVLYDF